MELSARVLIQKTLTQFVILMAVMPLTGVFSEAQVLSDLKKKVNRTAKQLDHSLTQAQKVLTTTGKKVKANVDEAEALLEQEANRAVAAITDLATYLKTMDLDEPSFIEDGVACLFEGNGIKLSKADIRVKTLANHAKAVEFSLTDADSSDNYMIHLEVKNLDGLKAEVSRTIINMTKAEMVSSENTEVFAEKLRLKSNCVVIPKSITDCVK